MSERIKNFVREAFLFLLFICYLRFRSTKLFTKKQIDEQIEKYAQSIISNCRNRKISEVTFVVILRGAKPFSEELLRRIALTSNLKFEIVYIRCSSYYMDTNPTEEVDVEIYNPEILKDHRNVIILEDIIEKGQTIKALVSKLMRYDIYLNSIYFLVDKSKGKKLYLPDAIEVKKGLIYSGPLFLYGFGPDLYRGLRWLGEIWGIEEQLFYRIQEKIIRSSFVKACF